MFYALSYFDRHSFDHSEKKKFLNSADKGVGHRAFPLRPTLHPVHRTSVQRSSSELRKEINVTFLTYGT